MAKHTVSEVEEDCATIFLERDGVTMVCPYHTSYDENGKPSNVNCGDWCSLFSLEEVGKKKIVYLLCGSGNAAYTVEE